MNKKIFSLISVYNKNKIEKICKLFKKYNIKIISTGKTAKYIKKRFASSDIILINASCIAKTLIPKSISTIAFGVFSLFCIIYK